MRAPLVRVGVLVTAVGLVGILLFALLSGRRSHSGSGGGVFYAGTTNGPEGTTLVLFRLLSPRECSVTYTLESLQTKNRADGEWTWYHLWSSNTVSIPRRSERLVQVQPPANTGAWRAVFRREEMPPLSDRVAGAVDRLLLGSANPGTTKWLSSPAMTGATPASNQEAPWIWLSSPYADIKGIPGLPAGTAPGLPTE
jgi:hypothetical protein